MQAESIVLDPRKMRCRRLRRTITEAARIHEAQADYESLGQGRSAYRKLFITLTYRHPGEWERCHISEFVRPMRQWFHRRGHACRFVWVSELQKRGALHYHLVVWVPRRLRLPCPDTCGWWRHGSSKVETARNPIGYLVKYATKTTPDALRKLPKGVRLHGNGGHTPCQRVQLRESLMPGWARSWWDQRCVEHHLAQDEQCERPSPPEGSDAWWEEYMAYEEQAQAEEREWLAYREHWGPKGFPCFQRVSGGMVQLRTGEFIPTPWRVDYDRGVLTITKKTECMQ